MGEGLSVLSVTEREWMGWTEHRVIIEETALKQSSGSLGPVLSLEEPALCLSPPELQFPQRTDGRKGSREGLTGVLGSDPVILMGRSQCYILHMTPIYKVISIFLFSLSQTLVSTK